MSYSNSKIVAISTVKHLSRNYASFQQPSVQEWYSLSTSGQAQSILQRNTADFHGDGYFLQNTGHEAEEISFVVCDVNSEQKRLQVEFLFWSEFFIWTTKNEQNWLYTKDQKQKKNGNNAQFHYPSIQNIFLLPLWEPVVPLCAILRAKSM